MHLTNVKDILLLREDENTEVKLRNIRQQVVTNAAELSSLPLYLRYKLDLVEGKRSTIGAKCLASQVFEIWRTLRLTTLVPEHLSPT